MGNSATETLRQYLAAQSRSADEALEFIAEDAVFDVGRGRYTGRDEIGRFVERLISVNSRSSVVEVRDVSGTEAVAVFEQRDDDLAPLGIDHIRLDVRVVTTGDGRIKAFHARPTPESIEALSAATAAGRSSEGVRLAQQAGTIPQAPGDDRPGG